MQKKNSSVMKTTRAQGKEVKQ